MWVWRRGICQQGTAWAKAQGRDKETESDGVKAESSVHGREGAGSRSDGGGGPESACAGTEQVLSKYSSSD